MDEGNRYFRLGLFVFVTATVAVAILFILGGRSLFQPTLTFETYFAESVSGLEVGSPVRFRGVTMGKVTEILISSSEYEVGTSPGKRRSYIVVRAQITASSAQIEQLQSESAEMVERGLRAQTQLAGITGQQFLALDFLDPKGQSPLEFDWKPNYWYVPSAPSLTGRIVGSAQKFLASLNEADVRALGQNLNKLLVNLNEKLNEVPVSELSADAKALLESTRKTIGHVDRAFAPGSPLDDFLQKLDRAGTRLDDLLASPGLKQTVDDLAAAAGRLRKFTESGDLDRLVKNADSAISRIDGLIGDSQYDVHLIVQDLRVAVGNLRALSDAIKRYPAGALVGGPPEKVKLPEK